LKASVNRLTSSPLLRDITERVLRRRWTNLYRGGAPIASLCRKVAIPASRHNLGAVRSLTDVVISCQAGPNTQRG
jgi:hypothetical protein